VEHYVTLFDARYAPQGLALHASLQRHAGAHRLWVLCMDEEAERLLDELHLPDVTTIPLREIETDAHRASRATQTVAEYCWTMTPFTFDAVLDRAPDAERVTYVDADVWLRRSPAPLLARFTDTGAAVLLTEHAYAPEHDNSARSGRFCVQFLTMVRGASDVPRRWWQERCLEWCYARVEDGRFGDQGYLEDWPERYGPLVHVVPEGGAFQAPWNATRFPYGEAVAYHFHGLRLAAGHRVVLNQHARYRLPEPHVKHVYRPYLEDLAVAVQRIEATGRSVAPQTERTGPVRERGPGLRERVARWRGSPYASRPRSVVRLP
jgi:hypothetical protein